MNKLYDMILAAFPDFSDDENDLDYIVAGNFARFIKMNLNNADVKKYFVFIEELIQKKEFENVVIVGILETMQNTYTMRERQKIKALLLPKSTNAWNKLNEFWENEQ